MIIKEILIFLEDYFQAVHTHDVHILDRVFHKDSRLYSKHGDNLAIHPYIIFKEMLRLRKSPAGAGCERCDQVLSVDILSLEMVSVKVSYNKIDGNALASLNLMKHEGRWQVFSMHFLRNNASLV